MLKAYFSTMFIKLERTSTCENLLTYMTLKSCLTHSRSNILPTYKLWRIIIRCTKEQGPSTCRRDFFLQSSMNEKKLLIAQAAAQGLWCVLCLCALYFSYQRDYSHLCKYTSLVSSPSVYIWAELHILSEQATAEMSKKLPTLLFVLLYRVLGIQASTSFFLSLQLFLFPWQLQVSTNKIKSPQNRTQCRSQYSTYLLESSVLLYFLSKLFSGKTALTSQRATYQWSGPLSGSV